MSQTQVDDFCEALSKVHYMQVSRTSYAAIPREARGIPHFTVPGLHGYLDHYHDGLQTTRVLLGLTDRRTQDSLQCLPFSPFSERLASDTAEDTNADFRFRNGYDNVDADGRGFFIDGTCASASILREPFFPRASMVSAFDCVFASSRPFVSSFFVAANSLAVLAREAYASSSSKHALATVSPKEEVQFLKTLLEQFHGEDQSLLPAVDFLWAADAMVLLNTMYPASISVSQHVIYEAYSLGPSREVDLIHFQISNSDATTVLGAPLRFLGIERGFVEDALTFWSKFSRPNYLHSAWTPLATLLERLLNQNGSFDLPLQEIDKTAFDLEQAVRASYFVHSCDGLQAPSDTSPLHGVRSPAQIRNHHVNPRFCGGQDHNGDRFEARGCLVGIPAMGLQHVCHLLIGAAQDKTVHAQYALNFGQLAVRVSSAADILTQKGDERTIKAISALGTDGDTMSCGTREEKLIVCKLQREAFTRNIDLIKPLVTNICAPKDEGERFRGDARAVAFIEQRRFQLQERDLVSVEERVASELLAAASKPL